MTDVNRMNSSPRVSMARKSKFTAVTALAICRRPGVSRAGSGSGDPVAKAKSVRAAKRLSERKRGLGRERMGKGHEQQAADPAGAI